MTDNVGKILFVDDNYEDVKNAISNLIENGMAVQFWDGKNDFPGSICNARIVVLDLNLSEGKMTRAAGGNYYLSAAEALSKIPGPFAVIILALDFDEEDPANLASYYNERFQGTPLGGVISKKGLTKDEEVENPQYLKELITSTVEEDKLLKLILTWEAVVDKAQDKAFSEITAKEIRSSVLTLVKSLCRDFGEESASRELVTTIMRLISRRVFETKEFEELDTLTKTINSDDVKTPSDYPSEQDIEIHNRLMFCKMGEGESVWTGDIFRTSGLSKHEMYSIVLTPMCDLVNVKTSKVLTCIGFPVSEEFFKDPEYPPYLIDKGVIDQAKKGDPDKTSEFIKNRYMFGKPKLPESLHFLWNFNDEGKTFGICFNFNNVMTMDATQILKEWKRVTRLDSPFIQELLEKYGRFVSRVGTPEINMSPIKLADIFKESNAPQKEKA